jgi:excisionase family DNA binding protein
MPDPEDLITLENAAVQARRSADTIRNWIRDGKLTGYRVDGGPFLRVDRGELAELLAPRPA